MCRLLPRRRCQASPGAQQARDAARSPTHSLRSSVLLLNCADRKRFLRQGHDEGAIFTPELRFADASSCVDTWDQYNSLVVVDCTPPTSKLCEVPSGLPHTSLAIQWLARLGGLMAGTTRELPLICVQYGPYSCTSAWYDVTRGHSLPGGPSLLWSTMASV